MPRDGEKTDATDGWWRFSCSLLVKLAVSAGLLLVLLPGLNFDSIAALIMRVQWMWLIVAFLLYLGSHVLNAWRWSLHAPEFGVVAAAGDFFTTYLSGLFFNLFAPGTVAGDSARVLRLGAAGERAAVFASVVVQRFSGVVVLAAIAGGAAWLQEELSIPWRLLVPALVGPFVLIVALIAAPSLVPTLMPRWRGFLRGDTWYTATMLTLTLALLYHTLQILSVVSLARGLEISIGTWSLAMLVPIVNVAGMVPLSIGGVGVREVSYTYLLEVHHVSTDQALALGLLHSAVVFGTAVAALPAFLTSSRAGRG